MDMAPNELQMLAGHMGHSVNIHKSVNRLQKNDIERTKVTKILRAAKSGTVWKGNTRMEVESASITDVPVEGENIQNMGSYF